MTASMISFAATALLAISLLAQSTPAGGHSAPGQTILSGFAGPVDVACDFRGNLYVAEQKTGRIVFCSPSGERVVLADGLDTPSGVAVDRKRNVYVSTTGRGEVWCIAPTGERSLLLEGLDGPGALVLDRDGTLLVLETGTGSMVRVPHVALPAPTNWRSLHGTAQDRDGGVWTAHREDGTVCRLTQTGKR